MSTTSAATAAPRATGYERPLDLYSRLSNSIARYGRSIEVEADERLYVRPLLETDDLLLLHACHCHEVMTRGGLVTQAKLAELFGVSQQRISMIEKRCKKAGALDEDGRVTATVGRVGVSVVQYCHHEWVDNHFGELVVAADDRGEMRLKHADRATLSRGSTASFPSRFATCTHASASAPSSRSRWWASDRARAEAGRRCGRATWRRR